MIKLTNASEGFENKVLYLNPAHIVSMYSEDNSEDSKTMIYGGLTGSTVIWTVLESMEDIINLINGGVSSVDFAPFGLLNGEPIKTEEEMLVHMNQSMDPKAAKLSTKSAKSSTKSAKSSTKSSAKSL